MPDRKLEYWYDWEIFGPDGDRIISLKESPPPLEKERLDDIDYVCQRITQFPEATLMNEYVWREIVMLRQKAFKEKKSAESLKKIFKAIMGHGNKRKDSSKIDDLKSMINMDISFFKEILEMIDNDQMTTDKAIEDYLTRGTIIDSEHYHKRLVEKSYYENVYYAYKRIYNELLSALTENEIFCFFEKATDNLPHPNATIDICPDGRDLTLVKKKSWYIWAADMNIEP